MLSFTAAVLFLFITPGPGVLSTAGLGAAYGFRPTLVYVLGLFCGSNFVALAVISGVAAAVFSWPLVATGLMAASLGYLLYLAGRIAFAGTRIAFMEAKAPPGFLSGLMLQSINPKAYAVNTTLFAGFPFGGGDLLFETLAKLLIANMIWVPVHLLWLWAGASLHRLNLSPRGQRRINFAMAAAMLGVVALALAAGLRNA